MLGAGFVIVAIAVAAVGLLWVLPAWRAGRAVRVVTCPETGLPTAVSADTGLIARQAWLGPAELRLKTCERWPKRRYCGQVCLDETV
jgi:hypothetical protein